MKGSLLLIDDDQGIREALTLLLEMEGYVVRSARNGAEALRALQEAQAPPAAILLDLMMPVMDGFEFRAQQLADAALEAIPTLVLTAGLINEQVHALNAAAYLRKPLDIDLLLDEVAKYAEAS